MLFFTCWSSGFAQSEWLLDSVSAFSLGEFSAGPNFTKYHYNADLQPTRIVSTRSEITYSYGTHDESFKRVETNGRVTSIYKKFNSNNQLLYKINESVVDDLGSLYRNEEVNEYLEGKLVVKRLRNSGLEKVLFYSYDGNKVTRIEEYQDEFLYETTENSYDEEGRLIEHLITDEINSDFKRYNYTFNKEGKLLEQKYTIKRDLAEETQITTYKSGNSVDSVIVLIYGNTSFHYGTLVTTTSVDGERVQRRYELFEPALSNASLQWYSVSRVQSFPHGDLSSYENFKVSNQDTMLHERVTYELINEEESSYTVRLIQQLFDEDGSTSHLATVFRDFVKVQMSGRLDESIDVEISPNPIGRGEYLTIDIGQAVVSTGIIFDLQGHKIQELNIGGKRRIRWRAPDIPGQYYIIFMADDGSRSQPKAFQVF